MFSTLICLGVGFGVGWVVFEQPQFANQIKQNILNWMKKNSGNSE